MIGPITCSDEGCEEAVQVTHVVMPDDEMAAFDAAVEEGIAAANAGRTIRYEDVRRWLLSWGTDKDLPPPECGLP